MNREIKFRAWDTDKKKYSNLELTDFMYQVRDKLIINGEYGGLGGRMVFQQFTGLLDKNGVEIYEGDILKTPAGVGEIKWDSCFRIYWNEKDNTTLHDVRAGHLEIIGNIHQHTNLIC